MRVAPGFTLVELVAALALTGLLLLGARELVSALGEGRDRLHQRVAAIDLAEHRRWLLRSLVANATTSGDSTSRFTGSSREARFQSWCRSAREDLEPCGVQLRVVGASHGDSLVATQDEGSSAGVFGEAGSLTLRFFDRDQQRWQGMWTEVAPPAAIAVAGATDTLILPLDGTRE